MSDSEQSKEPLIDQSDRMSSYGATSPMGSPGALQPVPSPNSNPLPAPLQHQTLISPWMQRKARNKRPPKHNLPKYQVQIRGIPDVRSGPPGSLDSDPYSQSIDDSPDNRPSRTDVYRAYDPDFSSDSSLSSDDEPVTPQRASSFRSLGSNPHATSDDSDGGPPIAHTYENGTVDNTLDGDPVTSNERPKRSVSFDPAFTQHTKYSLDLAKLGNRDGYQNLGGDDYTSPGRDPIRPSTDFFGRRVGVKASKKAFYLTLCLFLLGALAAILFFFIPRHIHVKQISIQITRPLYLNTTHTLEFTLQDTLLVSNPNYAAVTVNSITLQLTAVSTTGYAVYLTTNYAEVSKTFEPRTSNGDITINGLVSAAVPYSAYSQICAETFFFLYVSGYATAEMMSFSQNPSIAAELPRKRIDCPDNIFPNRL